MLVEWDVPFLLTSPLGTLPLNQEVHILEGGYGYTYLLDKDRCSAGPTPLRVTTDNIPQGDGMTLHPSFKPGYFITLAPTFWRSVGNELEPAGAYDKADPRIMADHLVRHLNAIFRADGRVQWTPRGYSGGDRMLDGVQVREWPVPANDGIVTSAVFTLHTRFPYVIDATQQSPSTDVVIDNVGNADFYPVFKVHGLVSSFTIANNTTGLQIVYNSSLPGAVNIGAGHYAEIDCFRNTVYLDGNGANLKPGIDVLETDFFPLVPGTNEVTCTVAADMLWQPAWA